MTGHERLFKPIEWPRLQDIISCYLYVQTIQKQLTNLDMFLRERIGP